MNNQIQLVLKSSTTEMSLNNHELGIYIVPELDGLTGLPEIRTTSGVNAGYDGGWTSAQNFDARSITIRGVIANTDIATVERLRKQLVSLLAQGKNEQLTLNLVTQAGNSYELEVRTIACEMAMQRVLTQQEFMIQLRADDPLIYDGGTSGESVIVQVQQAIGGFQINFELPLAISGGEGESTINNGGLEQVYPIIKMYGALHNPTFVNQTTNQQFQVNATLGFAEGAWHTPSELYEGTTINIPDAPDNAPLASFQLDGETSQNGTPTPDAPVPVNTTTGENVVKICGKNLFDKNSISTGYLNADGTIYSAESNYATSDFIAVKPNTAYSKTYTASPRTKYFNSAMQPLNTTTYQDIPIGGAAGTFTTPANAAYVRFSFPISGVNIDTTQLELGSTATAYEPYQGQSYPISLGSIELCKIGDYQDYIYKDGSDWKIHKAVGKAVLDGSVAPTATNTDATNTIRPRWESFLSPAPNSPATDRLLAKSNRFQAVSNWSADAEGIYYDEGNSGQVWLRISKTLASNQTQLVSWLQSNPVSLYYPLGSTVQTDTEITNEALIAQLEAVLGGRTYAGVNNITTITPNEQGTLEITYMTEKDADKRDVMVVDSRMRTVTLNGADIYHLIAAGSEFPMLAPGENKLLLRSDTPGDNGYADVNYKQGYLTI